MGRRRLPMACSKCGRTPDQVKIYSNRYCRDCMSLYNLQYRQREKERTGLTRAQLANLQMHIEVVSADDDELVGSDEVV